MRQWCRILAVIAIGSGLLLAAGAGARDLWAAPVDSASLQGTSARPVVVVPDRATVRSGPGTVYVRLGELKLGESAPALGRSQTSEWIQIEFQSETGSAGWVYAKFVTLEGAAIELLPVLEAPPTATLPPPPTPLPGTAAPLFFTPTRLPTFTAGPAVILPVFDASQPGRGGLPPALPIIGLFALGLFGGVMAFLRRNA